MLSHPPNHRLPKKAQFPFMFSEQNRRRKFQWTWSWCAKRVWSHLAAWCFSKLIKYGLIDGTLIVCSMSLRSLRNFARYLCSIIPGTWSEQQNINRKCRTPNHVFGLKVFTHCVIPFLLFVLILSGTLFSPRSGWCNLVLECDDFWLQLKDLLHQCILILKKNYSAVNNIGKTECNTAIKYYGRAIR